MRGVRSAPLKHVLKDITADLLGDADPPVDFDLSCAIAASGVGAVKHEDVRIVAFLAALGDSLRRHIGPAVVIDSVMDRIRPGGRYIITDVRRHDEVLAIRQIGGLLVKITRPDAPLLNTAVEDELNGWDGWGPRDPQRRRPLRALAPGGSGGCGSADWQDGASGRLTRFS